MILGFKTVFPWGEPTNFFQKIIAGVPKRPYPQASPSDMFPDFKPKLHTIRRGNRWRAGMKIHMASGVRTKKYAQFNTMVPELSLCKGVQTIVIYPDVRQIFISGPNRGLLSLFPKNEHETLAVNDGFKDVEQFWKWFELAAKDRNNWPEDESGFEGQIIHWTDLKYN